eukprot:TRINITY_DN60954_c0_g1_i1.p1 TRINITY_DN60954_c0_g1~~TRINITY_DN60954_c0_g1_i1.p1  ORF type:complete len:432 (+),score=98.63 TRINITY_DN60954_c0_g1_i1:101-1396(+)
MADYRSRSPRGRPGGLPVGLQAGGLIGLPIAATNGAAAEHRGGGDHKGGGKGKKGVAKVVPGELVPEGSSHGEKCAYCGVRASCEYGREMNYCSNWCHRAANFGRDVLCWDSQDVWQWMDGAGWGGFGKRLGRVNGGGRELLADVSEGRLRKAGVSRFKAKEMVKEIEYMRQGAWLQPEAPRHLIPLETVAELCRNQQKGLGKRWQSLVEDDKLRCFASYCPSAIPAAKAWAWFEKLQADLEWKDIRDEHYQKEGDTAPRRTIFVVSPGCQCVYKYAGVTVSPTPEPDFVAEIRKACMSAAGFDDSFQPNSCNVNLYRDGTDSVGWHSDNEDIFEMEYNDGLILSLSLGATRKFNMKRYPSTGMEQPHTTTLLMKHGDLCTMEGKFQRYYLHNVPKNMGGVSGPRINMTWRWITKHNRESGCTVKGAGNID